MTPPAVFYWLRWQRNLNADNRCYTSFQVEIKLARLGLAGCDSNALTALFETFGGLPRIIKPTPCMLNLMCLCDASGARLISHNALSWWDNEKWPEPATCQYQGWRCTDGPKFFFNPVFCYNFIACLSAWRRIPPLLTFLLGFIYFKTPFHTWLTLTRYYTTLREGLGDRIVTDTTFFMAKRQNIVNSGLYNFGRVQRGKLLLHTCVSLLSPLWSLMSTVDTLLWLHLGFISNSSMSFRLSIKCKNIIVYNSLITASIDYVSFSYKVLLGK